MVYVYNAAFRDASTNLGLGSAISVVTIILIMILLFPSVRQIVKEARAA